MNESEMVLRPYPSYIVVLHPTNLTIALYEETTYCEKA